MATPPPACCRIRKYTEVANPTRADGREFPALAAQVPIRTRVTEMKLAAAS